MRAAAKGSARTYIHVMARNSPLIAKPRRPPPVLICRKCLKRADDGRAIRRALKTELKARSRTRDEKRPRLLATGCFGLCPKRAVTVTGGAMLGRGEYLLLEREDQAAKAVDGLLERQPETRARVAGKDRT